MPDLQTPPPWEVLDANAYVVLAEIKTSLDVLQSFNCEGSEIREAMLGEGKLSVAECEIRLLRGLRGIAMLEIRNWYAVVQHVHERSLKRRHRELRTVFGNYLDNCPPLGKIRTPTSRIATKAVKETITVLVGGYKALREGGKRDVAKRKRKGLKGPKHQRIKVAVQHEDEIIEAMPKGQKNALAAAGLAKMLTEVGDDEQQGVSEHASDPDEQPR
jgi:hypothetical protein